MKRLQRMASDGDTKKVFVTVSELSASPGCRGMPPCLLHGLQRRPAMRKATLVVYAPAIYGLCRACWARPRPAKDDLGFFGVSLYVYWLFFKVIAIKLKQNMSIGAAGDAGPAHAKALAEDLACLWRWLYCLWWWLCWPLVL